MTTPAPLAAPPPATLTEVREKTYKRRDSWWTVLFVDPLAVRLVRWVAHHTSVTPNQLTVASFGLGLAAAAGFAGAGLGSAGLGSAGLAGAGRAFLVAGAVLYHLSFVVDCMDGKLARLTGGGSVFGAWLDYVFDRVRVLACTLALMGGQYLATRRAEFLVAGLGVVFLDMFRYLNALHMTKLRRDMRAQLTTGTGAQPVFADELTGDDLAELPSVPVVDLHGTLHRRYPAFARLRAYLLRHRIRAHLVSGVEFQMAVFIVGPLTGLVLPVTIGAGVLLAAFELAIIYKLWLATGEFSRILSGGAAGRTGEARGRPGEGC